MTTIEHDFDGSITSEINRFIAYINPFRYRSYYYDSETKLYYLNSRYYDSELGRFVNADDISYLNSNDFNGLNLYAYCANNPIMNVDTSGNAWWNPFSWNWKKAGNWFANIGKNIGNFFSKSWEVVAGTVGSAILVAAGASLSILSFGFLSNVGSAMIGAGVGSFLGGLQSIQNGNSYWSGYLGGMISGGITSLFVTFGPLAVSIAGGLTNFFGTLFTDLINGENIKSGNYWLNLIAESLLSGLFAIGSYYLGDASEILKFLNLNATFISIEIWSNFIFSSLYNTSRYILKDIARMIREKLM